MEQVPLGKVADINPKLGVKLVDDDICSFIPMEAVDELSARIERPQLRRYGDVKKGFTPFQEGDAIVAKITPCMENGKAAVARRLKGGVGLGSTEFHVIRPTDALVGDWFHYFWMRPETRKEAERHMTGSAGQKRVPADYLKQLEIPLPSREEQERAVAVFRNADRLRRVRRFELEMSEGFLGAVFLEMFGRFMGTPHATLEDVVDRVTVGHVGETSSQYCDIGVPFLRTQNVRRMFVDMADKRFVKPAFAKSNPKAILSAGDVLVSRVGANRGMAAVVPPAVAGASCANILIVKPGDKIVPEYLAFLINSELGQNELVGGSVGSAQGVVNTGSLAEWRIPIPDLKAQEGFRAAVLLHQRLNAAFAEALRQAEHLFQTLLHEAFGETA